jgi:hypothetical protein
VYRRLVAEHHPDRLIAKGVPEELLEIATARMAAINAGLCQDHEAPGGPAPALDAGRPPTTSRYASRPDDRGAARVEESPGSIEIR